MLLFLINIKPQSEISMVVLQDTHLGKCFTFLPPPAASFFVFSLNCSTICKLVISFCRPIWHFNSSFQIVYIYTSYLPLAWWLPLVCQHGSKTPLEIAAIILLPLKSRLRIFLVYFSCVGDFQYPTFIIISTTVLNIPHIIQDISPYIYIYIYISPWYSRYPLRGTQDIPTVLKGTTVLNIRYTGCHCGVHILYVQKQVTWQENLDIDTVKYLYSNLYSNKIRQWSEK